MERFEHVHINHHFHWLTKNEDLKLHHDTTHGQAADIFFNVLVVDKFVIFQPKNSSSTLRNGIRINMVK